MPNQLRVQSALLCDEARRAENGTTFLIGVYSGDMVLGGEPPFRIVQTIWIQAESLSDEIVRLEIRGKIDGKKFFDGDVETGPNLKGKILTIPVPIRGLEVKKEGVLIVDIREAGGRWRKILSQNFVIREKSSTAPPPPS